MSLVVVDVYGIFVRKADYIYDYVHINVYDHGEHIVIQRLNEPASIGYIER
jgi:hypothetical protein